MARTQVSIAWSRAASVAGEQGRAVRLAPGEEVRHRRSARISPPRHSRREARARAGWRASSGSISTSAGWWKAPIRFLPWRALTPVLPPTAESTWASRLVGTAIQSQPRFSSAAAKPARSPTTPPPTATTWSSRPIPASSIASSRRSTWPRLLLASPGGSTKRPAKSAPQPVGPAGRRDIRVGDQEQPARRQRRLGRSGREPISDHRRRQRRRRSGSTVRSWPLASLRTREMRLGVDRVARLGERAAAAASGSCRSSSGRSPRRPTRSAERSRRRRRARSRCSVRGSARGSRRR